MVENEIRDGVEPLFSDAATALGIEFRFFEDRVPGRFLLPEVMGGGVAWLDVDLDGFGHGDIVDFLERQGFQVVERDDPCGMSRSAEDAIHELYRDWISLDGGRFEVKLKQFFEEYTGKLVA
mgnify:CR=1 FL=1